MTEGLAVLIAWGELALLVAVLGYVVLHRR